VKYIGSDVKIIECPIVRESDGLAKSSRNALLATDEKAIAPTIFKSLSASVEYAMSHSVSDTRDKVMKEINALEDLNVVMVI
jgi:pantoate--beta-alanine ligase